MTWHPDFAPEEETSRVKIQIIQLGKDPQIYEVAEGITVNEFLLTHLPDIDLNRYSVILNGLPVWERQLLNNLFLNDGDKIAIVELPSGG